MRNPISIALLLLAFSLTPVAQACDYPAAVKIPDGKSATQEEITAASATVKKYLADLEAYNACLDAEFAALPVEQQTPEATAMKNKKYNATVDAMDAEALAFNEQLRAFKAANK
jgi:hypothetical protein